MTKYMLWNWDFNYADEFDIYGYDLIPTEEINKVLPILEKIWNTYSLDYTPKYEWQRFNLEVYFGTNEYFTFYELPFEFKEIDDDVAETIINTIGQFKGFGSRYGLFYSFKEQMIDEFIDSHELEEYSFECVEKYFKDIEN